jgi:hypothetical protein
MSNPLKIGGIVAIAIALLASGFAFGYIWNGERNQAVANHVRLHNINLGNMMHGFSDFGGTMGGFYDKIGSIVPTTGQILSLDETVKVAEAYIALYGNESLEIAEVMQFDNNFYAQAVESETGIHAFEILIDPSTAEVYPEPGPNMMWNTKYGMMGSRGMMGGFGGMMGGFRNISNNDMSVSPEQARELAQAKLDNLLPGTTVDEEVDVFYGYYTIHTLHDGEVVGMLSINGYTGQVWLHTWHGNFIYMTEHAHSGDEKP